jgi:phthiodiolone/phenolphthiodiolone dimycocerosates ketoreductase
VSAPPDVPRERVRLGVTGMSRLPGSRVAQAAAQAEAEGFDVVLWPDHLMAWHAAGLWQTRYTPLARHQPNPHEYFNVVACIAAAAGATTSVRLGAGVTDVARTHPATIAQQYLTIHHLSGGRAVLGVGAGEGENLLPYGLTTSRSVSRLEEGLEIIRLLWRSEEPVTRPSEFWPLRSAVLGLGAVDGTYPPIWVAAHGPRMLELTGRLGDGWLPMLQSPERYRSGLRAVSAAREQAGRAGDFTAAMWTFVCYGESREDCRLLFESPMYKTLGLLRPPQEFEEFGIPHPLGGAGLDGFVPTWLDERRTLELVDAVPVELVARAILHGSVDDIVADLEALGAAGLQLAVLGNVSFLTDRDRVRSSFEAQAELVKRMGATGARTGR